MTQLILAFNHYGLDEPARDSTVVFLFGMGLFFLVTAGIVLCLKFKAIREAGQIDRHVFNDPESMVVAAGLAIFALILILLVGGAGNGSVGFMLFGFLLNLVAFCLPSAPPVKTHTDPADDNPAE